jgi:hypothetical protein
MIINSTLPADSPAADLQNSRAASPTAGASNNPATETSLDESPDRMRELSQTGLEGDWTTQDSAAADTWMNYLRSNIPSQGGSARAAQAGQNPETVLLLLQT